MDKLSKKKPKDLYEILIIYNKHLINPINQNFEFLKEFICYTIKIKKFETLKIGLSYIKHIENYITIMAKNQEDIFKEIISAETVTKKKYKYYLELGKNLKFKKKEKDEDLEDNIGEEENKEEESKKEETISNNTLSIVISGTSEFEANKSDYKKENIIKQKQMDNSHINIGKKEKKLFLK